MLRRSVSAPLCAALLLATGCGSDEPTAPGGDVATGSASSGGPTERSVEVTRDARGVPHVFAETLADAMYGLGWATAQDRLFQIEFSRRWMRGRLAELFGRGPGDAILQRDVRIRTLGFGLHADAVAPKLPEDVRTPLEAYAAGINAWVASEGFALPPAFAEVGLESFEPFTPADALLVWERLREIFSGDDAENEIERLLQCAEGCPVPACNPGVDAAAAIVQSEQQASLHAPIEPQRKPLLFKASHAWAVAGSRTTTGKAVLHSDPQTAVTAPSPWYEAHIVATADGVDARGIGVAGAPGFLIGWSRHFATGATAGGGDISDLYQLQLSADRSQYMLDGEARDFETRTEVVAIQGESDLSFTVQTTHWGPVVTPLLTGAPAGAEFAMRHTDLVADDTHTVVALIRMLRATDLASYREALGAYRSPGIQALYADADGHIAYHAGVAIHKRKTAADGGTNPEPGRLPWDGSTTSQDWGEPLSVDERPHKIDPASGYLFSANHLAVTDEFPYYTGLVGVGDTERSYQLRALLGSALGDPAAKMTPEEVLAIHSDSGSEVLRVYREALDYAAANGLLAGRPGAVATQQALELWNGEMLNSDPITPLAKWLSNNLPFLFRQPTAPDLVCTYAGGEGGLCRWLKELDQDKGLIAAGSPDLDFLIGSAEKAWTAIGAGKGEPGSWAPSSSAFAVKYQSNFFCVNAEGVCSLDPAKEIEVELHNDTVGTILSQAGNSYSHWVNFADIEGSKSILPPGVSEDPAASSYQSGVSSWLAGQLEPAPLDKALVLEGASSTVVLPLDPLSSVAPRHTRALREQVVQLCIVECRAH